MARPSKKQQRERRYAAWRAEEERIAKLERVFIAVPSCKYKDVLMDTMRDRIIDLYNEAKFEHGDVLLEFLPKDYARQLLDWYFDEDEQAPFPAASPAGEHEATQSGQVQGQPQPPGGAHGHDPSEADAEIVALARDLVSLWENPNIKGLPRAERNAAIEGTRAKLIAAVVR